MSMVSTNKCSNLSFFTSEHFIDELYQVLKHENESSSFEVPILYFSVGHMYEIIISFPNLSVFESDIH